MKKIFHGSFVALALLALSTINFQLSTAHAQGTVFTYQGQLSDGGQPANGTNYGMVFYLYDAPTNGNLLGNLGIVSVTVSNGLFTVPLDFGNEFDGAARWLQISVQKSGSAFTQLIPRQQLTPTPYAIYAENADSLSALLVQSNTNGAPNLIGGSPVNFVSGGAVGATIAGGGAINYAGGTFSNSVTADFGTVSGGRNSQASGQFATVGGGRGNQASGFVSTIAGGDGNTASLDDTFVGGGWGNSAANDDATVSGGDNNNANGYASVISGGEQNTAGEDHTTVAGGSGNYAGGSYGAVGGGQNNNAGGAGDTLAGGFNNFSGGGNNSTISGGNNNNSSGSDAVIGGGQQNSVGDFFTTIGGGVNNTATNMSSVISGGTNNVSGGYASAVSGGSDNSAVGDYSTVGGGWRNLANGDSATVGGGYGNSAVDSATVAGGRVNSASDYLTTVAGGFGNQSLVYGSTIGGGFANSASGYMATIPGGASNVVSGSYSFAAGFNAQATNDDSFVWSDGSAVTGSTTNGQFMVRASGGVVIYSSSGISSGVSLAAGSGTWSSLSDRNAKDNFKTITPRQMLDKVAELPITQWSYKTEPGARHIGPMAQDFHAAFGLNGSDDRHIATVDEEGVALAAIQGLNQKLQDKDAEIQILKQQNDSLAERLNELAATVKSLSEKK